MEIFEFGHIDDGGLERKAIQMRIGRRGRRPGNSMTRRVSREVIVRGSVFLEV